MVDKKTDFLKIENHFAETEHIQSIPIFVNKLETVPLFTIIIPTYQRAKYLKEAIDSAITQETDIPYEIIVCNNGFDKKDTNDLMEQYREIPGFSYYVNESNIGMVGNWNRLFVLARTKYVIMLHDDDVISSQFIKIVNEICSAIGNFSFLQTKKSNVPIQNRIYGKSIKVFQFKLYDFAFGNVAHAPSGIVYNKEILEKSGGFSPEYYPSFDYASYVLLTYLAPSYIINASLTYYRIDDNTTFKGDILAQMMSIDGFLIGYILRKYYIPMFLQKIFIHQYILKYLYEVRTIYAYENEIHVLNFKSSKLKLSRLNFLLFNIIYGICSAIKYMFRYPRNVIVN